MTTRKHRLQILLIVVGIFVLGAITGASLDGVYRMHANNRTAPPSAAPKVKLFDSLREELNLTDEQAQKINTIVEETRAEFRSLQSEIGPRHEAARESARARIRELLTPEQQQVFNLKLAEKDAARKKSDPK